MGKPIRHRSGWRIRWFDETGERRSEVCPDHKTALYKLRLHQSEVEEIRRGLREPRPESRTFGELCDYWLKHRAPLKRSHKDDQSIIRVHLRPAFGDIRLREIRQEHIEPYLKAKAHLNPKTVANTLTLLITMLNAAKDDLRWLQSTPRIRKPRLAQNGADFRYLRTTDEVQRFLRAAHDEGEAVFALYATAVLTGLRAGELAALQWTDVDLDRRLITVQRSFDGPTKTGEVRHVPILDPLLPVLRAWRLRHPGKLVFTNQAGCMHGKSGRVFQEVLRRVLRVAGLHDQAQQGRRRGYICFHDLRHTFASHWVMSSGDIFRLQRILGHKSTAMTLRYAHLAPHAFAADYGRLGDLVAPSGADIVRLPRAR